MAKRVSKNQEIAIVLNEVDTYTNQLQANDLVVDLIVADQQEPAESQSDLDVEKIFSELDELNSTRSRIKFLHATYSLSTSVIANLLGIRYQHAYNTLLDNGKKG